MKELFVQLNNEFNADELNACQKHCSLVTTSYLKKMTQGYTLETVKNQCLSFVASSQFSDYLMDG